MSQNSCLRPQDGPRGAARAEATLCQRHGAACRLGGRRVQSGAEVLQEATRRRHTQARTELQTRRPWLLGTRHPRRPLFITALQSHQHHQGHLCKVDIAVWGLAPQSCLTLCDALDCRPPGSSVHGILQARIPQWAAMPSSRGPSQPGDQTCLSCIAGGFLTI